MKITEIQKKAENIFARRFIQVDIDFIRKADESPESWAEFLDAMLSEILSGDRINREDELDIVSCLDFQLHEVLSAKNTYEGCIYTHGNYRLDINVSDDDKKHAVFTLMEYVETTITGKCIK